MDKKEGEEKKKKSAYNDSCPETAKKAANAPAREITVLDFLQVALCTTTGNALHLLLPCPVQRK